MRAQRRGVAARAVPGGRAARGGATSRARGGGCCAACWPRRRRDRGPAPAGPRVGRLRARRPGVLPARRAQGARGSPCAGLSRGIVAFCALLVWRWSLAAARLRSHAGRLRVSQLPCTAGPYTAGMQQPAARAACRPLRMRHSLPWNAGLAADNFAGRVATGVQYAVRRCFIHFKNE